ncbi:aroma-sacti cluster domain-containing protein [Peterkaempfera bronchialis]|uniref:aroma-sacti cluster domain-containing protein n=1 Tax=Peterkaempfera bronchialis TaxID=2126346 RepID=UPI003C2DA6C1
MTDGHDDQAAVIDVIDDIDDVDDVLEVLEAAGIVVDGFTEEQRQVFRSLSAEELALLLEIKGRLDAVEPEVQAHGVVAGGALF